MNETVSVGYSYITIYTVIFSSMNLHFIAAVKIHVEIVVCRYRIIL